MPLERRASSLEWQETAELRASRREECGVRSSRDEVGGCTSARRDAAARIGGNDALSHAESSTPPSDNRDKTRPLPPCTQEATVLKYFRNVLESLYASSRKELCTWSPPFFFFLIPWKPRYTFFTLLLINGIFWHRAKCMRDKLLLRFSPAHILASRNELYCILVCSKLNMTPCGNLYQRLGEPQFMMYTMLSALLAVLFTPIPYSVGRWRFTLIGS